MRSDQLQRLVQNIRTIANTDSFVVRRDNKSAEWKNQLLHYLSNEVVRNHLCCLQPFQYYGSNSSAGVYAFKVNLYADHIYLKVNTKTLEAVSVCYDLWRKHPEERWIQDIALDLLLKQEVNAQKRFAEQMHQTMQAFPIHVLEDTHEQWDI